MSDLARRVGIVAWPAFMAAAAIEMFVFAFVEPASLHWLAGEALDLTPTTVYSLAFFVFWALAGCACAVVLWLSCSADEINASSRDA